MKTMKKRYIDHDGCKVTQEFNIKNQLIKATHYLSNSNSIDYINEYDTNTNHLIKTTYFCEDGQTIGYAEECDRNTGQLIKKLSYRANGMIKKIINF